MYAVIRSGGKQYRVTPGQTLRVERLEGQPGELVELDDVLLWNRDGELSVGEPKLEGVRVVCSVVEQGRARKILIFKKKRRKQYRRTKGHRQPFTALRVERISSAG